MLSPHTEVIGQSRTITEVQAPHMCLRMNSCINAGGHKRSGSSRVKGHRITIVSIAPVSASKQRSRQQTFVVFFLAVSHSTETESTSPHYRNYHSAFTHYKSYSCHCRYNYYSARHRLTFLSHVIFIFVSNLELYSH